MNGKDAKALRAILDLNYYCHGFRECSECIFYKMGECVEPNASLVQEAKKMVGGNKRNDKRKS